MEPPAPPRQRPKNRPPNAPFGVWLRALLPAVGTMVLAPVEASAAQAPSEGIPIVVMVAGLGLALSFLVAVGVAVDVAVTVGVGVGVACTTTLHAENSEVLLFGSVAVAVTTWPDCTVTGKVTLIVALQLASVGMSLKPMKVCPSPLPNGSHCTLSKNSTRNVVLGVLFKLP